VLEATLDRTVTVWSFCVRGHDALQDTLGHHSVPSAAAGGRLFVQHRSSPGPRRANPTASRGVSRLAGGLLEAEVEGLLLELDELSGADRGSWSGVLQRARRGHDSSAYWARFGALSKHHVVWENHQKSASIQTAADRHPVGYVLTPGNSGGQLILFPDLPFEDIAPIPDDAGNRPNGPAAATGFADDLCRELLRLAGAPEPEAPEVAPDWAGDPRYRLPAEAEGRARIDAIEDQIRALEAQIEDRRREITEATRLKALLFASGPRLDAAVADALLALGFTTEPTDAGPSGLGPSFTCPEGRLLGVADSPEDGPVGLAKLREATFRLLEDAERDEVHDPAKAILFGSAHRLAPPAERPACFTEKCVRTAQATSLALCDTCDLFAAVRHVLRSGNDKEARRMRVLLLTTSGEVKPDLPEGEGPRAT
jgi:hypothetical protein